MIFIFYFFGMCVYIYIYIYIYKHLKWGMRFKHWTPLLETLRFWEVSINIKLISFLWTPMNRDLLMGEVNYLYEIKYKLKASTSMVLKLLKSYFSTSNIKKPPTLMVILLIFLSHYYSKLLLVVVTVASYQTWKTIFFLNNPWWCLKINGLNGPSFYSNFVT